PSATGPRAGGGRIADRPRASTTSPPGRKRRPNTPPPLRGGGRSGGNPRRDTRPATQTSPPPSRPPAAGGRAPQAPGQTDAPFWRWRSAGRAGNGSGTAPREHATEPTG